VRILLPGGGHLLAAPQPAVYILNSLGGMRLRASTTFLVALLTAAWAASPSWLSCHLADLPVRLPGKPLVACSPT